MKDLAQCLTQISHSIQVASFPFLGIGYWSIFPLVSPFPVLFRETGHGKKLGLGKARQIQVHELSRPSEAFYHPQSSTQQHSLSPTRAPFAWIWGLWSHLTPLHLSAPGWDIRPNSKPQDQTLALTHVLGQENQATFNTFPLPRWISDEHFILVLLKSFKLCDKIDMFNIYRCPLSFWLLKSITESITHMHWTNNKIRHLS